MTRTVIDCDVHCAPRRLEDLHPYLDEAWVSFVSDTSSALSERPRDYPPGMGAVSTPSTLEELTALPADGLDRRIKILSCTSLDEIYRNPALSAVIASAINDWLREHWLDRDPSLRASMVVSYDDVDDAVAEIERLGDDDRFVQIVLPVRSPSFYGARRFHPLFETATRHDLAIALHAWGRPGLALSTNGAAQTFLEDYTGNMRIAQSHIVSLVAEGVFARFPDLRVVIQECGFLWLSHLIARADKEWRGVHREVPWVDALPSEYIRRQMRATTAPAHLGSDPRRSREAVELVGPDWLMYASDHPHQHGESTATIWDCLDDADAENVATGNATSFYRL